MTEWADRIKAIQDASGLSLTDLAREVGMSVSGLSDVRHGRSAEPRGMAAVRLHAMHERLTSAKPKGRAA